MADDDDDYGGFVFGDEQSGNADPASDRVSRRVVAAVLLVAIVMLAAIVYPFASSAVTGLFGDGSDDAGAGNTPAEPNGTPSGTASTESADERTVAGSPALDTTTSAVIDTTPPTPDTSTPTGQTDPPTPTATDTPAPTPTATDTPTPTPTATDTSTATGTAPSAAPTIASFAVTDRSAGGTARFDVGWNVTDADGDLVAVRMTLVADPDGAARTVVQRRFDAGGAQSAGETTVEVPDGSGTTYEIAIEVVDTNDNTALELTRVVADGDPDA